jgi:hypothetical protein
MQFYSFNLSIVFLFTLTDANKADSRICFVSRMQQKKCDIIGSVAFRTFAIKVLQCYRRDITIGVGLLHYEIDYAVRSLTDARRDYWCNKSLTDAISF